MTTRQTESTRLRSPRAIRIDIDAAVAELTPYASLRELCDACTGGYRPTLRADLDPRFALIARAFDDEMARRRSPIRAFRG